jgi:hypothetical protein
MISYSVYVVDDEPDLREGVTATLERDDQVEAFSTADRASVTDFKHSFSASVEYLVGFKPTRCVGSVAPLFREDIAQRFAAYLARMGLPELGMSPSVHPTSATARPGTGG